MEKYEERCLEACSYIRLAEIGGRWGMELAADILRTILGAVTRSFLLFKVIIWYRC